jgi:hypothetical protein
MATLSGCFVQLQIIRINEIRQQPKNRVFLFILSFLFKDQRTLNSSYLLLVVSGATPDTKVVPSGPRRGGTIKPDLVLKPQRIPKPLKKILIPFLAV